VDRALADFPELEYGLGLLGNDGRVKPAGRALSDLVAAARAEPPSPPPRAVALVLDLPAQVTKRSVTAPGGAFFEAFMDLAAAGERPAVVLAHRASDRDHLAARGITELITLDTAPR
jgi:hypothetical protein